MSSATAAAIYQILYGHPENLYGHRENPIAASGEGGQYQFEKPYEPAESSQTLYRWEDPSIFKAIKKGEYSRAIELINMGKNIRESRDGMTVMRLVTSKLDKATPGSVDETKLKEIMNLLIEKDEKGMLENAVRKYGGRRRSTRRNRRSTRRNRSRKH